MAVIVTVPGKRGEKDMKKHRWTIVFTACLLAFTVFLAMDTFVLPSVYQTEAIEMNMNMFSQAEAGSNTSGKDQTNEEDGEKGKTSKSKVTGESDETEGSENTEETKESGNAEGAKESGNSEETDDPGNADETVETETAKGTEEQGETEESSKPGSGTGGHRKKPGGSSAGKPGRSSTSMPGESSAGKSGGSSKGDSGSSSGSSSFDEEEALESAAAVTTDNAESSDSYEDENIKITYTQYTTNGTTIHVADVQLSSAEYLKTAFAQDTYGKNVTEATSSIAEAHDAVLAINGDYYGVQEKGYVIRNGVVYRDKAGDSEVLCIYADGSMKIVDPSSVTAQELVDQGVWQAFSFGPGLLENGQILVDTQDEVDRAKTSNPRTALGQIGEGHYVLVVSDGRTDESEGLSLYELAQFLQQQGVQTAYNLDGGGSSTMVFLGRVVNQPVGGRGNGQRAVTDIVYV
jgi:exopolysaccharide biosynthesis protein